MFAEWNVHWPCDISAVDDVRRFWRHAARHPDIHGAGHLPELPALRARRDGSVYLRGWTRAPRLQRQVLPLPLSGKAALRGGDGRERNVHRHHWPRAQRHPASTARLLLPQVEN